MPYRPCPKCKQKGVTICSDIYGVYENCIYCGYNSYLKDVIAQPRVPRVRPEIQSGIQFPDNKLPNDKPVKLI